MKTHSDVAFKTGFPVTADDIRLAAEKTNALLGELPANLFKSIDFKTTSAMIGAMFCHEIATVTGAAVNPIEKGHPDVIPNHAATLPESRLRNYPEGLEIKCTVGSVPTGSNLRAGDSRIDQLTGLTWQAHHREVKRLLGVVWDFADKGQAFHHPAITGTFYSAHLVEDDWGAISGTTGRNTKVTGMTSSGRKKMGEGWVAIEDQAKYLDKYQQILGFSVEEGQEKDSGTSKTPRGRKKDTAMKTDGKAKGKTRA
jgi:hypothetical protein